MKVIWWFAVLVLSTVSLPSPSTFNIDCRGGNGGFNGGGGGGGCGNLLSGLQIHRGCRADRVKDGIDESGTCTFPFKYLGRVYDECTREGKDTGGEFWCATKVDETSRELKSNSRFWGLCPSRPADRDNCGSCLARRADNGIGSTAYCKFPFRSKFNYKTYTTCTRSENPDLSGREVGSGWCATEVDEFGFAVREKHGLCVEERCDEQDDAVRGGGGRGRSALEFDPCQEGSLVAGASCDQYQFCVHGEWTTQNCSPGLHWDNSSQVCNFPDVAGCGETVISDIN